MPRGLPCEFPSFRGISIGGTNPGQGSSNTNLGDNQSGQLSGTANVVIGDSAGQSMRGASRCTFVGAAAGNSNISGINTMLGYQAGYSPAALGTTYATTTGTGQTLIGYQTGQAVVSATAPNYITCLGYYTTVGAAGGVAIGTDHTGAGATTSVQDQIVLGTTNHTTLFPGNAIFTVNTPAVTSGSVTVISNARVSNVVVSAGTAITMSTSGAVDSEMVIVRITDGGTGQTLSWVNTENSTVSAPLISPGSATLPTTVGFQYNGNTSKWRCLAVA
jgi:hypothetical protein